MDGRERKGRKVIMPVDGKLQCTKCKEWKELDCFSPNRQRACGVSCHCRPCQNEYARLAYQKDPERVIKRAKEWKEDNPERVKSLKTKYLPKVRKIFDEDRRKRPHVWSARKAVNNAIRAGKLSRQPCEVCGATKTDAHHDSYAKEKWLDVRWLCRSHHLLLHSELKRLGKELE